MLLIKCNLGYQSRRMNWAGQMTHMGKEEHEYWFLAGRPEGKM
jgi:hypothetical protein